MIHYEAGPRPGSPAGGRETPDPGGRVGPAPVSTRRLPLTYVLPLRWTDDDRLAGLTDYLRWLAGLVDVVVVDGSPPELFERHATRWRGLLRHLPPDPDLHGLNGKVNGVVTGLRQARHEHVVIADDDIRYNRFALVETDRLLAGTDLVRPQNYFHPLPWHARWDTARSLLNRVLGGDYPGTLGVRRSTFLRIGGYDGNVLFENLELIRTVRAHGGTETRAAGLYVRRLPPDTATFLGQRVRQAYDDLAQPVRLLAFLAVLPALGVVVARGRPRLLLGAAAGAVGLAELGRSRAGGRAVFPPTASLLAPAWILERAVCGWLAMARRVTLGGVRYAGQRVRVAAHRQTTLNRRAAVARKGIFSSLER